jgi:hypothetical protein
MISRFSRKGWLATLQVSIGLPPPKPISESAFSRHFFKQRRPAQSLPSHHNRALQPTPFELMTERGNFTRPGHHAFQPA